MEWSWKYDIVIPPKLLEAIRSLPAHRDISHCGETFLISPFDIYFDCPRCGSHIKVRSFTSNLDLEDVFDVVFEWMNQPGAEEHVRRRRHEIEHDPD